MIRSNMTKWINNAWMWLKKPVAGIPKWGWAVLATVVLVLIALFWDWIWCWLRDSVWSWMREELGGNDLSNLTVILGAIIGISLAFWRSTTAHRQANVAQRGLQIERYQKGADMLGSDRLATRIGGIYALERLAQDHPEEYHIQVMDLICAIVKHPEIGYSSTRNEIPSLLPLSLSENEKGIDPDIQKALDVVGRRNQTQRNLEKKKDRLLDLSESHLNHARLIGDHLENILLMGAHLNGAFLQRAHLEDSDLRIANLNNAKLMGAHLDRSKLTRARLQNANLKGVKGLTQAMLDSAAHYYDEEGKLLPGPNLEGAFCAESGKPLVWRTPPKPSSTSDSDETNSS